MNNQALVHLFHEELYQIPSRTVVVIDKPWTECDDEEKTLLIKILGSVKLSLAGVHIVSKKEFSVHDLSALNPERVICFGARLKEIGTLYDSVTIGGTPVICADGLKELTDSAKKSLWVGLRQMFKL
jgi:hypothetical protein